MNKFFSKVVAFVREEEGLTMVEYAIGAAVIAAAGLAFFKSIGTGLNTAADTASTAVTTNTSTATVGTF